MGNFAENLNLGNLVCPPIMISFAVNSTMAWIDFEKLMLQSDESMII